MSDQDEKLVKVGAVKDKVWQLTEFHRDLGNVVSRETICDAINALLSVEGVQGAVSRDETIRRIRGYKPERKVVRRDIVVSDLVRAVTGLPPVLPVAESRRSEEEIRRAIDCLRNKHKFSAANLLAWGFRLPQQRPLIECWDDKDFAPSASNQDTSRNEVREKEKEEPGGRED